MGVGPAYRHRLKERIESGVYHTESDPDWYNPQKTLPNPNPKNYQILDAREIGKYLVVKINYPDCTNFEGDKIMLYKDCNLLALVKQKEIDPHFCADENVLSPIARFEPTDEGWEMATNIALNMSV